MQLPRNNELAQQSLAICLLGCRAWYSSKMALILFLAFSLFLQGALGELICEELPVGMCSFAISSSGKRCLLETSASLDGATEFQCRTSPVQVKNLKEHIENDECIRACGLDRYSVGISSDTLLDPRFASKICSPACSNNCPNVLDLYDNLAVAEGVSLPDLCKVLMTSPRRAMVQLLSSGAASGPVSAAAGEADAPCSDAAFPPATSESGDSLVLAPAPAPAPL